MCVAADPNRPRLIVEKARRRKEMLGMPKRYSQLASSTHIPFKSSAVVVDSLKCFTTAGSLFFIVEQNLYNRC